MGWVSWLLGLQSLSGSKKSLGEGFGLAVLVPPAGETAGGEDGEVVLTLQMSLDVGDRRPGIFLVPGFRDSAIDGWSAE